MMDEQSVLGMRVITSYELPLGTVGLINTVVFEKALRETLRTEEQIQNLVEQGVELGQIVVKRFEYEGTVNITEGETAPGTQGA